MIGEAERHEQRHQCHQRHAHRFPREQREARAPARCAALTAPLPLEQDLDPVVRGGEQQELNAHAGKGMGIALYAMFEPAVTASSRTV
jgi:hypothetical protein